MLPVFPCKTTLVYDCSGNCNIRNEKNYNWINFTANFTESPYFVKISKKFTMSFSESVLKIAEWIYFWQ